MRLLVRWLESEFIFSEERENIMLGKLGILGILTLLSFTTGCTMCCHPYDNCGPVFDNSCGSFCSTARAGSILEGGTPQVKADPFVPEETTEGLQEVPTTGEPQLAPQTEPQTLSAIDLNAGKPATASKKAATRHIRQAGDYAKPMVRRW
jgi:hypothetical protein